MLAKFTNASSQVREIADTMRKLNTSALKQISPAKLSPSHVHLMSNRSDAVVTESEDDGGGIHKEDIQNIHIKDK